MSWPRQTKRGGTVDLEIGLERETLVSEIVALANHNALTYLSWWG